MPFALVLTLARVYDRQARYRALGDALVQDVMTEIRQDGLESVLRDRSNTFIPIEEDFANRESLLQEAYNGALEALESYKR